MSQAGLSLSRRSGSDSNGGAGSNDKSNSAKDQSWTSKYSQYKILGFPLYIWLFALTAVGICIGVGIFMWKKKQREKAEAAQLEWEAQQAREAERERRKRGIPPDPEEELDEADRTKDAWQTPQAQAPGTEYGEKEEVEDEDGEDYEEDDEDEDEHGLQSHYEDPQRRRRGDAQSTRHHQQPMRSPRYPEKAYRR